MLKNRTTFLILPALFLAFFFGGLFSLHAAEETQTWQVLEAQAVDNDDIELKVAQREAPLPDVQSSGGVVWGKSGKTEGAASETVTENKAVSSQSAQSVPLPKLPTNPTTSSNAFPTPSDAKAVDVSNEKFLLASNRRVGSTDLVEILLEVTGEMKALNAAQETVRDKMEFMSGFRYEERVDRFSLNQVPLVSVRQYNLAKGKMKVGEKTSNPELDSRLQTIVSYLDQDKVSLFSSEDSLRGEEMLLIEDLPGNTLTLDRLLPNRAVALGEGWKIPDGMLCTFLSLDGIEENNVEAILTAVADNMAMVEVVGDVTGLYLGAPTQMSVRAKFQFDLTQKRINWLGMLIEEDRSIGHVSPGFDLVAKLQVKIAPQEKPQNLTDEMMASIDMRKTEAALKLKYDGGKGPWRFYHSRDWYVYQDEPTTTVLRQLSGTNLVAQCNIADMGTASTLGPASLASFQQELIQGLGSNFGKVVAAEERTNAFGYKELSVILDGVVEDLPLRWLYTLITDQNGRQAVVVFVVEARMLKEFGDSDRVLLDTFRLGK